MAFANTVGFGLLSYVVGAWVVGSVAAIVWYRFCRETGGGVSLGYASAEG
jgi:hypothetical protein